MRAPNFCFIGPSKTGSTWIFEALRSHPEVFVPTAKDIYFFDKNFGRGLEWYKSFFPASNAERVAGEVCHDYFSSAVAMERLVQSYPSMKLITCLRNPFHRSLSSADFIRRNGLVSGGIEEVAARFPEVVDESRYAQHLTRVFAHASREQVLILWFDELESNPLKFVTRIYEFLEVSPGHIPLVLEQTVNQRQKARSVLLAWLAKSLALAIRRAGYPTIVGRLKRSQAIQRALFRPAPSTYQHVPLDDLQFLAREILPEIEQLEALLGVTLDHWRPLQLRPNVSP